MTFLEPGTALLTAAIAVPALIALYLLKLRRKPVKVSSTLLWEQAASDLQANVPLRWLRASVTLIIQLLALICLLLALARPTVKSAAETSERLIVIVDRSASMSAADGVRPAGARSSGVVSAGASSAAFSRLDQAKAQARALIDDTRRASGRRPSVMVLDVAAGARILTPFTDDPGTLGDAIDAITPTDQAADLGSVVPLIRAALLEPEDRAAVTTTIAVFSDGALTPVARDSLPSGALVRLIRAGPESSTFPDNLGIVAFAARRDAAKPEIVRLFARVQNSSSAALTASLLVAIDGASAGIMPLSIPAATRSADGAMIVGEAAGTLELTRPAAGLITLTIPRADVLASDNTVGANLPPIEKPSVLVVGPGAGDAATDLMRGASGVDRFLRGVLAEMELPSLRIIDIRTYTTQVAVSGAPGTQARPDLVIFDRCQPEKPPTSASLHIGAGVPIKGLSVRPVEPAQPTRMLSWRRTHPALRYANLEALLIARPMRVVIDDPPAGTATGISPATPATATESPTITPIAFGAAGPLMVDISGPGVAAPRRLVLGFDLLETNWGPDVSFPVFVASAVEYLTHRGDAAAARAGTTSEPVTIRTVPGTTSVSVSGPVTMSLPVSSDGASALLGVPERVGTYTFVGAVASDGVLPVNLLSAAESAAGTSDRAEGLFGRLVAERSGGVEPARSGSGSREVWHWFVLMAMGLLTIEWFVYAWKSRA